MVNARGILSLIVAFLLCLFLTISATAQDNRGIFVSSERLALVIGNNAYQTAPLRNPVNDAEDMGKVLSTLGFKVILQKNVDRRAMEDSIRSFGRQLRNGGVGLFYFAGHGMQVEGRNYIIPINGRIESESDIKYEAVDAGLVLGKMEDAKNQLNIVILDACRINPFSRNFRNTEQGLARMDAPKGALIAYSTAPGEVAADGPERNGVFTKHLIRHIQTPNLPVEQLLKRVRIDVATETIQRQIPWESSSLMGDFYFQHEKSVPNSQKAATEQASLPERVFDKPVLKTNKKIAIFPFFIESFDGSSGTEAYIKDLISILEDVLKEYKTFVPTYTFYDLKNEFHAEKLPKQIMNEESIKQLWVSNFFSTKKPNLDLICKLGNDLKVDNVLIYWVSVSRNYRTVKAFLIDVREKKLSEKVEEEKGYGTSQTTSIKFIAQSVTVAIFN